MQLLVPDIRIKGPWYATPSGLYWHWRTYYITLSHCCTLLLLYPTLLTCATSNRFAGLSSLGMQHPLASIGFGIHQVQFNSLHKSSFLTALCTRCWLLLNQMLFAPDTVHQVACRDSFEVCMKQVLIILGLFVDCCCSRYIVIRGDACIVISVKIRN